MSIINGTELRIVKRDISSFKWCLEESNSFLKFSVIYLSALGKSDQLYKNTKGIHDSRSLIYIKNKLSSMYEETIVMDILHWNKFVVSTPYIIHSFLSLCSK